MIMPGVRIGRNAVIRQAVIDKYTDIPMALRSESIWNATGNGSPSVRAAWWSSARATVEL